MRILLVNDDGYNADGLKALAYSLGKEHDVTVVAPEANCSGFSNSITINKPVNMREAQTEEYLPNESDLFGARSPLVYIVSGTPVDCTYLALNTIFRNSFPDFIISGINQGENLAEDTLYSGTVGAAMEGFLFGVPSIAISQQLMPSDMRFLKASAELFNQIFNKIVSDISNGIYQSNNLLLNINIPHFSDQSNLPTDVKFTRLGRRQRAKVPIEMPSQAGIGTDYMVGAHGDPPEYLTPGTDLHAISMGKISITPLQIDLTNHAVMDNEGGLGVDYKINVPDRLKKKIIRES